MPPKTPSRASATTTTSSAILRSAFSPPSSQWSLFASVVQGLDAQRLRIHEVSSLRLVAEHALAPKEQLLSLDWGLAEGPAPAAASVSAKKRRRTSSVSSSSVSVVAFGTNTGSVKIYSPAENKLLAVLDGQHDRPVVDVKFTAGSSHELYSLAADGKLCRWDVKAAKCTKSISLPSTALSTLSRPVASDPPVLAASQTPFLVHLDPTAGPGAGAGADSIVSFAAMKNTIHTLIPSSTTNLANAHFLAADSDRYINLFDIEKRKLLGNLVATKEVEALALSLSAQKTEQQRRTQLLAAITRDGTVEFFAHPFTLSPGAAAGAGAAASSSASLKAQRKSQTRRCSASLTIRRPNSASPVPLIAAQFAADGDLLVAYVENGVVPVFERVKVVDEESGEIAWSGKKEVVREKVNALAANANAINAGVNGVAGREVRVDESRTVVESGIGGNDGMDIDEEEEEEEAEEEEKKEDVSDAETPQHKDADADADAMDVDSAEGEEDDEDDNAEPSFGDLIKAQEVVDVAATLADHTTNPTPNTPTTALTPAALASTTTSTTTGKPTGGKPAKSTVSTTTTTGISLANVLSQALKTNDTNLLESCFHTTDTTIVRATIQRIDSALAATLLQRLAERLSTRPGRYGHLLVWVQWTCVAHGGSIAGKQGMLRQLADVFKVMEQRSASLAPLLLLKGKLDMLDAQLGLRRALRGEERRRGEEEMEDEENVIYVEGMEDVEDEEENDGEGRLLIEEARTGATPAAKKMKRKRDAKEAGLIGDDELEMFSDGEEEEESGDGMPLTVNDVDSDDSENEEGSSDEELVDEEAEVSGEDDSGDEDDEDDDEDDDEEEGSDMDDFINDDESEEEEEEEEEKPKRKSSKTGKARR